MQVSVHAILLSVLAATIAFPFALAAARALVALGLRLPWGALFGARRGNDGDFELRLSSSLRRDLSREAFFLAQATRGLVHSLAHALNEKALWRDDMNSTWWSSWVRRFGQHDERTTIVTTGEVWEWLRSAETIGLSDDPDAEPILRHASRVRAALFGPGLPAERLRRVLTHLGEADRSFGAHSSPHPYRAGGLEQLDHSAVEVNSEADEASEHRRRRQEQLLAQDETIEHVARRFARDDASRADLAQDIRVAVWVALKRFRGDASVRTYVRRIANNRAVTFLRRRREFVPYEEQPQGGEDLDQWLDAARMHQDLNEAIAGLPGGQREVMRLLLEGYSYREISEQLGLRPGTTSARVTRARQALRRRLAASES